MLSFLAFLAHADTITLDTGAVVEGVLNRYEHGGDCEVKVTGGDLEGVVLIAPCFRVQSFVRTERAPVPVARFEPPPALPPVVEEGAAVVDAAPQAPPALPMPPPEPVAYAAPDYSAPPPAYGPPPSTYAAPPEGYAPPAPPMEQQRVAAPSPAPYSMFGPAPDSAQMPQLEMPMAEPEPPPPVEELPVQEGSAIPGESRPVSF
ncbi:MAG TPA: hypothetical protein PKW90_27660 [Myxococcota bacterium]|nr:hypothetical protein [Myxococcota bacterium]